MLRVDPARLPMPPSGAGSPAPPITLRSFGGVLRQSWPIIAACIVLCVAGAASFVMLSVPVYSAATQLLIEPQRQQQLLSFEAGMLDLTLDNAQVESQIELLRSERITSAVVKALGLSEDPEFQREDGWLSWLRGSPETPARDAESERVRVATAILTRRVGVRRVGQSYVIEITAQAFRPERAAEVANAYTDAYMRDQFDAKARVARSGADWLQARISDLRVELNGSARAVEDFKIRNDLASGHSGLLVEQQLSEMNSQLVTARAQTTQASARLARIQAVLQAGTSTAAVAEILNNQVMTNLRQRQQDAAQREAEARERYGPEHSSVVAARGEVEQAERDVATEVRRIAQIYLSDHDIAVSRERGIELRIRQLIAEADRRRLARVTLSELEAQAQSYRRMYQNLLEKLSETVQKETLPVTSARVIAPATTPLDKSSPRGKLTLALGTAVGLLLGVAISTVRYTLDQTVRSSADLQRVPGLSCLALLPAVGKRLRGRAKPLGLEAIDAPFSGYTRALRGVKIALDIAREGRTVGTLGITSVSSGEGKTSVALNLACLSAQANCRTLLIDADFLDCSLTRMLAPGATEGLLEMLADGRDTILPTRVPNLDILPAVFSARPAQSSDILRSKQMHEVLNRVAGTYDLVVLDLSAMQATTDARAIGRILDGMILVATWGETERDSVEMAAITLEAAYCRLLGVVLNKVRDGGAVARAV
ncbi:Tyrosine-protein kinase etk [Methylobacterium frigidaeris]|uniref:Tyrosine-protein kinase etk n=2 Tax=Methylobacterium frigidaeris TaxID=2038277 RepID=A0AA37HEX4_9HYPH|nr:Tyrosine-protein kinase etk [Methylobacterium frigidaeris]